MNGIAISLYDKFEDLAVLVDIIRHNWTDDYYISVSSNHPDAEDKLAGIDIDVDEFQQGAQIRYDDSLPGPRSGSNLSYRIYDNIRTSCRPVIENENVDYLMHLHADAWQLSESGFTDIIDEMVQEDVAVAFPSQTHGFDDVHPPGSLEDQFIVFDVHAARDVDLFSRRTLDFPPTGIHQLISMICIVNFGWGKMYHYTNGAEREHWDGTPSTKIKNDARPMFFNPKHDQLHVARGDFTGSLGKELQAHYLSEYGIDEGSSIDRLLKNHHRPREELFADLESYLEYLDEKLPLGITVDTFGRDIRVVRHYLESKSPMERLKILIGQHEDSIAYPALKGLFESFQRLRRPTSRDGSYNEYPETTLNEFYRRDLDLYDFPPEMHGQFQQSFGCSED